MGSQIHSSLLGAYLYQAPSPEAAWVPWDHQEESQWANGMGAHPPAVPPQQRTLMKATPAQRKEGGVATATGMFSYPGFIPVQPGLTAQPATMRDGTYQPGFAIARDYMDQWMGWNGPSWPHPSWPPSLTRHFVLGARQEEASFKAGWERGPFIALFHLPSVPVPHSPFPIQSANPSANIYCSCT